MVIHCVAAEHGVMIKKKRKERKKESLWIELKSFPTNIGWPNKITRK